MRLKNYLEEKEDKMAGWIAIYNRKKLEIKKSEAKDLYGAKQIAIKKLKVPKSKVGLLAIDVAYDDDVKEGILSRKMKSMEKDLDKYTNPKNDKKQKKPKGIVARKMANMKQDL